MKPLTKLTLLFLLVVGLVIAVTFSPVYASMRAKQTVEFNGRVAQFTATPPQATPTSTLEPYPTNPPIVETTQPTEEQPTAQPTQEPTQSAPTPTPTQEITPVITQQPTTEPTQQPTEEPTQTPEAQVG
jgi:hypothetical protein